MSLINEALKRAQQEKGRLGGTSTSDLPVCQERPASRSGWYLLAGAVVLVGAALVISGWFMIPPVPDLAGAAPQSQIPQRPVVPVVNPPDPQTYRNDRALSPQAAETFEKTVAAVQTYQAPPEEYPVRPEFDLQAPRSPAGALDITDALSTVQPPAAELRAAIPATKAPAPATPQPKAQPKAPQVDSPAKPALVLAADDARPFRAANYRLTGIMNGPEGTIVIINGFPVQLGDMVEDAKVVLIERYSVVLEVNGRNFRIRM